jgi:hypothetical protein
MAHVGQAAAAELTIFGSKTQHTFNALSRLSPKGKVTPDS